jgi:2,3-bisphosphoglycerate-independent phosphoglycerate mutase
MLALIVLDGWGLSATWQGNAINLANPPFFDALWRTYPHAVLQPYEVQIGKTKPKLGSSDVGHAILGSGRLLHSDLDEILEAITHGSFEKNPVLLKTFDRAREGSGRLHLIGLVSDGGVHGDPAILTALLKEAKKYNLKEVFVHIITDGRDVLPKSAGSYIGELEKNLTKLGIGKIATVLGRELAMDRDHHWERTRQAYELWSMGRGQKFATPETAIRSAYQRGFRDETLPPFVIDPQGAILDNDTVIFCNTRADRLQQMVRAFVDPTALRPFIRRQVPLRKLRDAVSLVSPRFPLENLEIAFPPATIRETLPEILAGRGLKQLRVAESEKAAHVSYMFNGGRLVPFEQEDWLIVPSPRQRMTPASATSELVDRTLNKLAKTPYDFTLINLANVDLTAHGGELMSTAQAVLDADRALKRLVEAFLARQSTVIITADHGNAEQMLGLSGPTGHRAHSANPVPFILVAPDRQKNLVQQATSASPSFLANIVRSKATLADVAPTILELFGIPIPVEMTGSSLLSKLQ